MPPDVVQTPRTARLLHIINSEYVRQMMKLKVGFLTFLFLSLVLTSYIGSWNETSGGICASCEGAEGGTGR